MGTSTSERCPSAWTVESRASKGSRRGPQAYQVKRETDPDPGDDDDGPNDMDEDDDWADVPDGASQGSRSSRRRRNRKEEVRWRGGAPPEIPAFSSTLGRYKDFDIWIRKLEVYKK